MSMGDVCAKVQRNMPGYSHFHLCITIQDIFSCTTGAWVQMWSHIMYLRAHLWHACGWQTCSFICRYACRHTQSTCLHADIVFMPTHKYIQNVCVCVCSMCSGHTQAMNVQM